MSASKCLCVSGMCASEENMSEACASRSKARRRAGWRVRAAGCALAVAGAFGAVPAHAQFAVIDVAALMQWAQQALYWQQQLVGLRAQIAEVKATRDALTGQRGMERVMTVTNAARNYLPADFPGLERIVTVGALAREVQGIANAHAVLKAEYLARMSDGGADSVQRRRTRRAARQALARSVYAELSARFARLDELRTSIATARDDKAIEELDARIGVEQTMLANDQAKLAALEQVMVSEEEAGRQQVFEQALAAHGQFATRFQPVPGP